MKRKRVISKLFCIMLFLIIFYGIVFLIGLGLTSMLISDNSSHPIGKDTYLYLGDGSFQLIRSHAIADGDSIKTIILVYEDSSIDMRVFAYLDYQNKLYTIGIGGYTVSDYVNNTYEQYNSFDELLEEYRKIFTSKKFKYY